MKSHNLPYTARILHAALGSLPCLNRSLPSHSLVTPVQGGETGLDDPNNPQALDDLLPWSDTLPASCRLNS
ncbi:hypothetical protein [Paenibacillus sp. LHD-38]|uniref:hypothetical protein n=1 Tax=Paenibacillus sp. LHD-38 TaxID=3072143 RepID=UPI00280E628A|nr:hypothetical protein [Paenibacillus sp. LHD-38]MDQ8739015.1 hypothetical protein [Paenibacillus sp. LHD-38]